MNTHTHSALGGAVICVMSAIWGGACSDKLSGESEDTDSSSSDTDADTDTDTDTDSDTDADTDTDTGSFDCSNVPAAPLSSEIVEGATGFHDVAFDKQGFIIGSDDSSLIKATSAGDSEVFVTSFGLAEGMDTLPNGDLVIATYGQGLVRVTPEGEVKVINSSWYSLYGTMVGPDGMVYVADNENLYRVNPETGDREVLVDGIKARGCDFSPDHSRLYITTSDNEGKIYVADLDDQLNVVGAPTVFAQIPFGAIFLDGIRVDICGNVYVPVFDYSNLYRITPDGELSVYIDWDDSLTSYGHGIKWGIDDGGWDPYSAYLPLPYGDHKVLRVEIGVPYRP